jgi:RNA recognition motif-containing protein
LRLDCFIHFISQNHNGSAFIEYEVPEAAQIARDFMNGKMVGGERIIVLPASEVTLNTLFDFQN